MGIKKKSLRTGDLIVPNKNASAFFRRLYKLGIVICYRDENIIEVYWIYKEATRAVSLSKVKRINHRYSK